MTDISIGIRTSEHDLQPAEDRGGKGPDAVAPRFGQMWRNDPGRFFLLSMKLIPLKKIVVSEYYTKRYVFVQA